MENPEASLLGEIRWQLFATLTFRQLSLSERVRITLFFAWLRKLAANFRGVHFHRLKWCLRQEMGELGGREHEHSLICGLPPLAVQETTCLILMRQWESLGGGIARVRVYDPKLDGVGYVLKGEAEFCLTAANAYEFAKFRGGCNLMLSKSVITYLMRRRREDLRAIQDHENRAKTSDPWAASSWLWTSKRHPYAKPA